MNQDCSQCAYYIENKKDIEATNEKFSLLIEAATDKIDMMIENNDKNFNQLKEEVKAVDNRLSAIHADLQNQMTEFKRKLPSEIDERIKSNAASKALNIVKWVFVSVGGSVVISIATSYFGKILGA